MIGNLSDIMRNMENGTYNFCKKGKCSCCGKCCGNLLPMTEDEIKKIKQYIKIHNIKSHTHLTIPAVAKLDLTCPFLDDAKELKCTIYEVRPRVCRDFICDPKQRPVLDMEYGMSCRSVFVREEFFGGK